MSRELLKQWIHSASSGPTPILYSANSPTEPDLLVAYMDIFEVPYTGDILEAGDTFKYDLGGYTVSVTKPNWDVRSKANRKKVESTLMKWKPQTLNESAAGQFVLRSQFTWG